MEGRLMVVESIEHSLETEQVTVGIDLRCE